MSKVILMWHTASVFKSKTKSLQVRRSREGIKLHAGGIWKYPNGDIVVN